VGRVSGSMGERSFGYPGVPCRAVSYQELLFTCLSGKRWAVSNCLGFWKEGSDVSVSSGGSS